MTGYFARLATRTGVGGESAPAARDAAPSPLATEDTVTFVAQPERSAPAPATPQPVAESFAEPTVPTAVAAPAAPAPFAPPELPDADRPLARSPGRSAQSPDLPPHLAPAASPPGNQGIAPPAAVAVSIPERPHTDAPGIREAAEARIARSAIAVPARSDDDIARPVDPDQHLSPLFRPVPALAPADIAAPAERVHALRPADLPVPARRPDAPPEFQSAPPDRVDDTVARNAAPARPANGHVRPRPQAAPSVRIGSIQVDVHAAPPPPPQAPARSAFAAPPSARAPSLRRFYLRDW